MKYLFISGTSDIGFALIKNLKQKNEIISTYNKTKPILAKNVKSIKLDISSRSQIKKFCKNKLIKNWDCLVMLPASQDPVGLFSNVNGDEWVKSIDLNFTNQIFLLKELLPFKSKKKNFINPVIFWAGGGTNNAPKNYSAYIVSKIAQIKMVELLDEEIPEMKFSIIGPGWVKTKIHKATFKAKHMAGQNYLNTKTRFKTNNFVPIKDVVSCFNQIVKSPKRVFGGRNISTENDHWNDKDLQNILISDQNAFKLRRSKNDLKKSDLDFDINKLLNFIYSEKKLHNPKSYLYKKFKDILHIKFSHVFFKNKKINNLLDLKINFPYVEMGNINSIHLFNLDELLIFKYYLKNKNNYKKVCDIGGNIGLHSLIMNKCGFKVDTFEPDPKHCSIAKKIFTKNRVRVNLYQKAVADFTGSTTFTRVLNNSTGSYIGNKKEGYGPLKKFNVKVLNSSNLRNKYDLIKIDAEGSEYDILKKFKKIDFNKTDFIIEISTKLSREKLWIFFKKYKLKTYAQKNCWKITKSLSDLPSSPKEGSVIISKNLKL